MNAAVDHTRRHRVSAVLRREFTELAIISGYLYICFGALLLFKTATLRAQGIGFAPYGIAAVKSLVLGKFILIGNGLHIGARFTDRPLIHSLAYKVLIFVAFLFFLSLVEEAAIAVLHGRPATEALSNFGTWLQITASCILLCLILIPYFGLKAIGDRLAAGTLRLLFFGK
jgi:hypothetical protein